MKMIINGKRADAVSGKTFDNINPFNGELINNIPLAEKADYEIAVQAARNAQPEWYMTPLQERMEILSRFVSLVRKNQDDIVSMMCAEGGKLIGEAKNEINSLCAVFESCILSARHFFGSSADEAENDHSQREVVFTERTPLGVFMILVPSSFPVELFAYRAAPALAAGNAVIIKPALETSGSAIMLTELMKQARMPDGVVQCVTGTDSAVREFLREADGIDAVCASGGKGTISGFLRESTSYFQRIFADGGNNSAFVVLDTAELEFAVEQAVVDRTFNAGQSDYAARCFFVQKSVSSEFLQLLAERLERIKAGDPTDSRVNLGPLVSTENAEKVVRQIAVVVSMGAKCVIGGDRDGSFVLPTVLLDAPVDTDIAGPVFPLIEFEAVDEVVVKLNQMNCGPICRIFSKNIGAAMRIAADIKAENCVINGGGTFGGVQMPGSGDKYLELGAKEFKFPFLDYTREKMIYISTELPLL